MSFEKNGFDESVAATNGKPTTNGTGEAVNIAASSQVESPVRLGTTFGAGSTQSIADAQGVRRPVVSVKQPGQNATMHVGKGVKLKGEINSCGMLTIEGEVEAQVTVGHLQISNGGSFEGTAIVEDAEIDGRFDGTLQVSGKLVVRRGGRVAGKLSYGQIEVERGAEIHGRVTAQFGPHKKNVSPMPTLRKSWFSGS